MVGSKICHPEHKRDICSSHGKELKFVSVKNYQVKEILFGVRSLVPILVIIS